MPGIHVLPNGQHYRVDLTPSRPDLRDWLFTPPPDLLIPDDMDLVSGFCYDQGQEGSCTGNAQAKIFRMMLKLQGYTDYEVSRAMIYYNSRMLEGTVNQDSGSTIEDSMKAFAKWGACNEQMMPYVPGDYTRAPSAAAYAEGLNHQVLSYGIVGQTELEIGAALAMGHPISIGTSIYSNFAPDANGIIPMPSGGLEGAHDLVVSGRILSKRLYIIDNSWSQFWGIILSGTPGRAYLPFDYVHNPQITFEMRVMSNVEGVIVPPKPAATVKMIMGMQPTNGVVGTPLTPYTVQLLRADDSVNVDDNSTVVTSKLHGFSNTRLAKAANGVAAFTGDTPQNPHTGANAVWYDLTAPGLPAIMSAKFEVTPTPTPPPPPPSPTVVKTHTIDIYSDGHIVDTPAPQASTALPVL